MSERDFEYIVRRAKDLACSDASYAPSTSEVNGLKWAESEIGRLRIELFRANHKWKTGFVCGYVCAAANVIRTHDLPTVALDLLREGIGKEDISAVDESDLETLVNADSRIATYLSRN